MAKKFVSTITSQTENFAQWYTDVCVKAELMSYSDVKGFIIYRPYGYAIWENIQQYLNTKFKQTGHDNVYLPLLIPESLFQKEKDHVEGFAPETAMVTTTGKEDLNERLIIRPTSEVLFCTHFKSVVQSHRDLPKKYNQWCSVVRWEKTTRPFLRGKEFLWQEGHTIHASEQEAKEETMNMLTIYEKLGKDMLAIPFITGQKTEKEKFAGAEATYSIEALMPDGQALQSGTTHYFGQGFAKAFDISYRDQDNLEQFVYQTSWGVSTRLLGAIIMVHGDDDGLVMPPYVAPTQIVIVPISNDENVLKEATTVFESLKDHYRVMMDTSDKSPGWKFSEYEMKGVPVRIEIGKRDLDNKQVTLATRYNRQKQQVSIHEVVGIIPELLNTIHQEMYEKAQAYVESHTFHVNDYELFKEKIALGGYVSMSVHEDAEAIIKADTQATARVIPFDQSKLEITCPVTGKKASQIILFAKAY
ncbi:MAG TPA: proline--tRNA ligase [Acholeplasmataceae bacterium]|nr:proline--tRNA ligase [Acholeplasmataceae bacterium]